jgi:predicted ATPase
MATLTLQRGRLDLETGRLVPFEGQEAATLTETERRLVCYLAAQGGEPVGREDLQTAVWDYRPGVLSRTVFTTVGRARAKLEVDPRSPTHLVSVPGEGYALRTSGADVPVRATPRPSTPPLAPLIGRDAELAAAADALAAGARLLTLHGPGGVGKTRLAQAILQELRGRAAMSAFVALETRERADELAGALADGLHLALGDGIDPLGEVATALADGPALVVLDNVEHLLPELLAHIERLLASCPDLQLLTTTRLRLGLRAEHVLTVRDLELPADGARLELAAAGRLALEAARRARVGWVPSDTERDQLAALCGRVGGLPLAIELAISWLRVMSPDELLDELGEGASVLESADRDRPARHRSVAVALDASWRLLGGHAARALEALGVFSGPFDRRLAEVVAGAGVSALGQLVDAAMVRRAPSGFDLHPLLRRSARARLAADPDREATVRARHVDAVLDRLCEAHVRTRGQPDGARALAEALQPVRADVLDAWLRAAELGRIDRLQHAGGALVAFLDGGHEPWTAIAAVTGAADRLAAASRPDSGALVAALRLVAVGSGGPVPADLAAAAAAASELPGALGTLALIHAAIGSHMAGCPADGVVWGRQAVARADDAGDDPYLRVFPRGVLGSLLLRLGRLDEAHAILVEGVGLSAGNRGQARSLVHLGQVELALGRPAVASDVLSSAIGRLRAAGDRTFTVMGLTSLAAAAEALGDDPTPLLEEAVEESVRSRLPPVWSAGALARLAAQRLAADRPEDAAIFAARVDPSAIAAPTDRAVWTAVSAEVRARLDPATYARRSAEGAALDPIALLDLLG